MNLGTLLSFPKAAAPFAVALLTLASLSPQAEAQCFSPDGYDSPACCAPVTPNVPAFGGFSLPATGICWTDCTLTSETCIKLLVDTPVQVDCSKYLADVTAFDCIAGVTLMKGTMTLDYTRTWAETPLPGGPPNQVWRLTAKVDMDAPIATASFCPVPNCAQVPGGNAFYYGYVDYALNCITGAVDNALVLYHGCDAFAHDPGLSSVPGTFHPTSTFAIVGPDTAANPFTPSISLPPAGTLIGQGMRRTMATPIALCTATERLIQGGFQPLVSGCLCPPSFQPPQQSGNKLTGSGMCGGAFTSLNYYPIVPWYELIVTSIGRWTNASSYPGPEHASVAEGLFLYSDGCEPTTVNALSIDILYGGLTQFGYTVDPTLPGAPPTSRFLDLASNYSNPTSLPLSFPVLGTVKPTDHLIFVNF